ncbi:HRDC-like protein [Umbelopsis sp. PMI_123]|nr:HRDC-like protein [Umbelopsis sp. PMI_123]
MEVVQSRAALLSNFEVLQLLNERMESQKQRQKEYPNLEYAENLRTIQFEIKTALDKSACSTQDEQQVLAFLEAMKKWQLTKAEKLQILNLRPKTPVELHILIEECEERYSGEQLEELLEIIMQVLPRDDDYVAEEEEQQQEEG